MPDRARGNPAAMLKPAPPAAARIDPCRTSSGDSSSRSAGRSGRTSLRRPQLCYRCPEYSSHREPKPDLSGSALRHPKSVLVSTLLDARQRPSHKQAVKVLRNQRDYNGEHLAKRVSHSFHGVAFAFRAAHIFVEKFNCFVHRLAGRSMMLQGNIEQLGDGQAVLEQTHDATPSLQVGVRKHIGPRVVLNRFEELGSLDEIQQSFWNTDQFREFRARIARP